MHNYTSSVNALSYNNTSWQISNSKQRHSSPSFSSSDDNFPQKLAAYLTAFTDPADSSLTPFEQAIVKLPQNLRTKLTNSGFTNLKAGEKNQVISTIQETPGAMDEVLATAGQKG